MENGLVATKKSGIVACHCFNCKEATNKLGIDTF
jgi:hypothetical protein